MVVISLHLSTFAGVRYSFSDILQISHPIILLRMSDEQTPRRRRFVYPSILAKNYFAIEDPLLILIYRIQVFPPLLSHSAVVADFDRVRDVPSLVTCP